VQLRKRLALATTFTLRFDNAPLPDVRKVDTVSALSLVYRVL
jgi:putative salt-induced outer membrane protein